MEKGSTVTFGLSIRQNLEKNERRDRVVSVPPLCFFRGEGSACASCEWLIPSCANTDLYAAVEQLTLQMIWSPLDELILKTIRPHPVFSKGAAIPLLLLKQPSKKPPASLIFMFQNGKPRLYSLGVHPNFLRKASLKWLMLLYPTNPATSFT